MASPTMGTKSLLVTLQLHHKAETRSFKGSEQTFDVHCSDGRDGPKVSPSLQLAPYQ
jgi:hypothetical protein